MRKPSIESSQCAAIVTDLSRNDLQVGQIVSCTDVNPDTARSPHHWYLMDTPVGSSAYVSSPTNTTCSFTPDVSGSYLLRCEVDKAGFDELILSVPILGSVRIPAYKETDQYREKDGVKGWHAAMTKFMRTVDANWQNTVKVCHIDLGLDYVAKYWPTLTNAAVAMGGTELPAGAKILFARATVYETAAATRRMSCTVSVGTEKHAEDGLCTKLDCFGLVGSMVDVGKENPRAQGVQPILTFNATGGTFSELTAGRIGVDVFY
jgi:hypothetical protein